MRHTVITALAALLLAASPAWAERIDVPKDHPTLQAAVDAAQDGDQIVVRSDQQGIVQILGKRNLTIRGRGKPVVGDLDIVNSTGIRIQGLVIRGSGGASLYLYRSDDVSVKKCRIPDAPGHGVLVDGGDAFVLERCRIENAGGCGVALGGEATFGTAAGALIRKNRIEGAAQVGIAAFDARDTRVEKNRVSGADIGVYAGPSSETRPRNSVRTTMTRNHVESCRMGIATVFSRDNVIDRNLCEDLEEVAYTVAGDETVQGDGGNNRLTRNSATRVEYGFFVASDQNVIEDNEVKLATKSGFWVVGMYVDGNRLSDNTAKRSGEHGFYVMGTAQTLDGNTGKRSDGCAFYIDATGCTLTGNTGRKSGDYDLDDWRGGNVYHDNDFPTIAPHAN